jgi:hypothetical protein
MEHDNQLCSFGALQFLRTVTYLHAFDALNSVGH